MLALVQELDADPLPTPGLWWPVAVVGVIALVLLVITVVALHSHALLELWQEEHRIRHIERDLGRR